jgi:predicted amidophosphoribosyltransferase
MTIAKTGRPGAEQTPRIGAIGQLPGYLDRLTECWLGWSMPPVGEVISDAGWKRDVPSDYCPRCGDSVGEGEAIATGCGTCREGGVSLRPIEGIVRLGPYSGDLRNWILDVKYYRRWGEMAHALGCVLGEAMLERRIVSRERTVVVPMPMPWQRRVYRGIDHARVIACGVGKTLRTPVALILARSNGRPQVSLPPSERARSGPRGLRVRRRWRGWDLRGLQVVLVDDVRTTGASLRAAARLLQTLRPERLVAAVVAVSDAAARRDRAAQGVGSRSANPW